MYKNIGIIIQARTGSSRLPNKILKKILPKKTFLEYLVDRLKKVKTIKKIIIATSKKRDDDKIFGLKFRNIYFHRGPEKNVIKRYIETAEKYGLKHILRITADCPFSDAKLIDKLTIKYFRGKYSYVSNVNPPTLPNGFDIEIFSLKLLKKSYTNYKDKMNKEHVTFAIRKKMKTRKYNYRLSKNLNHIRLTLDNKTDLFKIRKVAKYINIADDWKTIYLKNFKINNEK